MINPREKTLLYIAISIAVVLIIGSWIILPTQNYLSTIRAQVHAKSIKLAQFQKTLQEKELLEKQYQNISQALAATHKTHEEATAKALAVLEESARKASIQLQDMKPLPLKNPEGLPKILIAIEAKADPQALFKLLYTLENDSSFYIEILKINASEDAGGSLNFYCLISKLIL